MSTFRSVFIAVVVATALLVAGVLINARRPAVERAQPTPQLVEATGKCAACHRQETGAIVVEYEQSRHAAVGTNCLDCHKALEGQERFEHRGFTLTRRITPRNCAECHATQYDEFLRSRHAAPAYAAVLGNAPFTAEQVAFAEQYNPGGVRRPPNPLVAAEGDAATAAGCVSCHQIGQPHRDGSIGNCTACHARHATSVALARLPTTCGQCHLGPDHSQLEIYQESKHGVLFNAQRARLNLEADPKRLTVRDMPVPTCATCHMSGLGGQGMTHDVGQRLSWYLFAAVSTKRPTYLRGQNAMKAICLNCHTRPHVERVYRQAEAVVAATNARVGEATRLLDGLRKDGLIGDRPFAQPIDFTFFDLWHYYGRTTKHGAFMGGADYIQWHGNYELLAHWVRLQAEAQQLRRERGGMAGGAAPGRSR